MIRGTRLRLMSIIMHQLEMNTVVTVKDKPVNSWSEEFLKPPVSKEMERKHGPYAKYSDPALAKVDVSDEIVLNTYPDGPRDGRIEVTYPLKEFHAGLWDEAFFRKYILKPKPKDEDTDKARTLDYMLNAVFGGFLVYFLRYVMLPLWYVGQPRMSMVAQMNIEAEVGVLAPKQCKTVVWRGKPIYVYHRSERQLSEMVSTPMSALKDPETDEHRFPDRRDHAVVIAICTHLGCIPIPNEGLFNGFFCPCHGSHYDVSGRIRMGPAPLNLEVPPYKWINDENIYLGKL